MGTRPGDARRLALATILLLVGITEASPCEPPAYVFHGAAGSVYGDSVIIPPASAAPPRAVVLGPVDCIIRDGFES